MATDEVAVSDYSTLAELRRFHLLAGEGKTLAAMEETRRHLDQAIADWREIMTFRFRDEFADISKARESVEALIRTLEELRNDSWEVRRLLAMTQ